MIQTFEDLFEKLEADGRCRSVPDGQWKRIQTENATLREMTGTDRAVLWMTGYLFCLADESYISQEEWDTLHGLLMNEISE